MSVRDIPVNLLLFITLYGGIAMGCLVITVLDCVGLEQDAPVQDTPVQAPTAQSLTEVPSEEEVEPSAIDSDIEQLLESRCVEAQLY